MARVRLEGVRKVYDDGATHIAVHGVDLEVGDGEFVVLVGPSGCGKSTTLRMIAGLESITAGRLLIGDRIVNDVPPAERDIAMVFQNYALYPHMSVRENMAFALKLRKMPQPEIRRRVEEAATLLDIEPILSRRPRQLSGGQRQRVAIGRAIVRQPQVFLFDEPLSNLDAKLRVQMRREIAALHRRLRTTVVYVTHDQVEAMTLGDRIVVLNEGRVQQVDTPLALYARPRNRFVAGFIGSPAMNFISGSIVRDGGLSFRADGSPLTFPLSGPLEERLVRYAGRHVIAGIRPEHVSVAVPAKGGAGVATMTLDAVEPMGNEVHLHGRTGELELTARVVPQPLPQPGAPIDLALDLAQLHAFDAETGDAV